MASDGHCMISSWVPPSGVLTTGGGFFALAAIVLYLYEHMITFSDEVRCIWRRRVPGAGLLFLLNRYALLVASLASIVQVIPWDAVLPRWAARNTSSYPDDLGTYDAVCTVSLRIANTSLVIGGLAYTGFAALRMFALYGMRKYVFIIIFVVGLFSPSAQIFGMIFENRNAHSSYAVAADNIPLRRLTCLNSMRLEYSNHHGANFERAAGYISIATRVHAILFEGIVMAMTWKKTFARWNLHKMVIRTPYTTMLLKDGTMYSVIIVLASALNMVGALTCLPSLNETRLDSPMLALLSSSSLVNTITSICMCRFILGLLALSLDDSDLPCRPSRWDTLRFAPVVWTVVEGVSAELEDDLVGDKEDVVADVDLTIRGEGDRVREV